MDLINYVTKAMVILDIMFSRESSPGISLLFIKYNALFNGLVLGIDNLHCLSGSNSLLQGFEIQCYVFSVPEVEYYTS